MASQQITEEAVYLCTGNLLPKDIEQISYWLLNEQYSESFKRINDMKTRKGLALVDIVREVTMFVFKIKIPPAVRVQLVNDLADIEVIRIKERRLNFRAPNILNEQFEKEGNLERL
ncbi:replication factor C subunit 3-like isoform X2 [Vicia villosa]|nr:replication factor C subunit 3-like isoform X2 [Vicia villosa]